MQATRNQSLTEELERARHLFSIVGIYWFDYSQHQLSEGNIVQLKNSIVDVLSKMQSEMKEQAAYTETIVYMSQRKYVIEQKLPPITTTV